VRGFLRAAKVGRWVDFIGRRAPCGAKTEENRPQILPLLTGLCRRKSLRDSFSNHFAEKHFRALKACWRRGR